MSDGLNVKEIQGSSAYGDSKMQGGAGVTNGRSSDVIMHGGSP